MIYIPHGGNPVRDVSRFGRTQFSILELIQTVPIVCCSQSRLLLPGRDFSSGELILLHECCNFFLVHQSQLLISKDARLVENASCFRSDAFDELKIVPLYRSFDNSGSGCLNFNRSCALITWQEKPTQEPISHHAKRQDYKNSPDPPGDQPSLLSSFTRHLFPPYGQVHLNG